MSKPQYMWNWTDDDLASVLRIRWWHFLRLRAWLAELIIGRQRFHAVIENQIRMRDQLVRSGWAPSPEETKEVEG